MAPAGFEQQRPMSIESITHAAAGLKIEFYRQTNKIARFVSAESGINEATSALKIRDEAGPWLNEVIAKDERATGQCARQPIEDTGTKDFAQGLDVAGKEA